MSNNPFQALLSIQDEQEKTSKRAQKKANTPKLTPAERAKHKEEMQKQRQEVVDNSTDNFNFVKYEENDNVGFITTDDKKSKGTTGTLTKDQFLQSEDRQQLIDNKAKSSPKTGNKGQGKGQNKGGQGKTGGQGQGQRTGGQGKTGGQGQGQRKTGEQREGGQREGGQREGGQREGGQGKGQGRPQNRGQGQREGGQREGGQREGGQREGGQREGGQGQNRGKQNYKGVNKQGGSGGAGGEGGDKKGGDPGKKNYVKKDRSKGNPKNASKRPGAGGAFNWDSNENLVKKDVNAGELVEELEKVPEPEPELEEGSVEEWFPAEVDEEAGEKVKQPEVKRVGLSAYLAEKKEEEEADAKSKALLEQLAGGHKRELNTNIPSHANISKKEVIPAQDTFFFGAPKTQKSKAKTTENTSTPNILVVDFKMKKHHGFNMPRERKEGDRDQDSPDNTKRRDRNDRPPRERGDRDSRDSRDNQGQRRPRDNQGQKGEGRQNRNNNNNNRPKNQFSKNNKEFPPLGGKVAPQKDATWAGRTDDL